MVANIWSLTAIYTFWMDITTKKTINQALRREA